MTKSVKVIATFNEEGEICPLWAQISHHGKIFRYKVLDCRNVSDIKSEVIRNLNFQCIVKLDGSDSCRDLSLEYSVIYHNWHTVVNDSLFR